MKKIDFGQWWYELDQRLKIGMMALFAVVIIGLCVVVVLVVTSVFSPPPESKPTPTATELAVTILPPSPKPTSTPKAEPTDVPPSPTQESPLETPPTPLQVDPQGDVGTYDTGEPVEESPASVDIRTASVGAGMRVTLQPTEGVPAELADWAAEGDVLLWITLHEPIPDPPTAYTEWLFALDLDGDAGTGRPEDKKGRIDPDIGMDVAVAVYYDPESGQYATYCLVWNAEQVKWASGPQARYYLNESRTLIGLAVPLGELTDAATQNTGITAAPEAVKGRAGALTRVAGQKIIDFYPDLPD